MADVRLTVQDIKRQGLKATYTSVTSADTYLVNNDGNAFVHVKNTGTGAETVTLHTAKTINGLTIEDPTVSVPAGEDRFIGPFPPGILNDGQDVEITFAVGGTTTTVAAMRLT